MSDFDPRLLCCEIEIDGKMHVYEEVYIQASGQKTANTLQNECTIKIGNLSKPVRHYLITETSPYNLPRKRKRIVLYAGRQSYGSFKLFEGDILSCTPSQPPDVMLTIKAKTGAYFMSESTTNSYAGPTSLNTIARDTASGMGLTLNFQARDKLVSNYNYSGAKLQQVNKLAEAGSYNAYVDDDRLIIKNADAPLENLAITLNKNTGMIGMPEITEQGIKVKYLLDPESRPGARLTVESELNPVTSGSFVIYKINFEVCNRETSWYTIAECRRLGLWQAQI
ncbi:baseplate hub protein [Entomohabitans teleogrylli]|uniref:baseplate hub protein n=1 Tax=Entomohabitans teleogrylli TaxID=1384589 RepID=UPI00073D5D78|nr:hypothetical protein [Entomohabitans teleogrylli]